MRKRRKAIGRARLGRTTPGTGEAFGVGTIGCNTAIALGRTIGGPATPFPRINAKQPRNVVAAGIEDSLAGPCGSGCAVRVAKAAGRQTRSDLEAKGARRHAQLLGAAGA